VALSTLSHVTAASDQYSSDTWMSTVMVSKAYISEWHFRPCGRKHASRPSIIWKVFFSFSVVAGGVTGRKMIMGLLISQILQWILQVETESIPRILEKFRENVPLYTYDKMRCKMLYRKLPVNVESRPRLYIANWFASRQLGFLVMLCSVWPVICLWLFQWSVCELAGLAKRTSTLNSCNTFFGEMSVFVKRNTYLMIW